MLKWKPVKDAVSYIVLKNGKKITLIQSNSFNIENDSTAEYQVIAIDKNRVESFASEPIMIADYKNVFTYQAEQFATKPDSNYKGFSGDGFAETSTTINRKLSFTINIETAGLYSIDFRYANGNGPINTENKCAIRIVLPQRGKMNGAIGVTAIQ